MVLTLSRQFVTLTGTGKAVRVFFFTDFFLCFMYFIMFSLFLFFTRYRSSVELNSTTRSVLSGPVSGWNRRAILQFFDVIAPQTPAV